MKVCKKCGGQSSYEGPDCNHCGNTGFEPEEGKPAAEPRPIQTGDISKSDLEYLSRVFVDHEGTSNDQYTRIMDWLKREIAKRA